MGLVFLSPSHHRWEALVMFLVKSAAKPATVLIILPLNLMYQFNLLDCLSSRATTYCALSLDEWEMLSFLIFSTLCVRALSRSHPSLPWPFVTVVKTNKLTKSLDWSLGLLPRDFCLTSLPAGWLGFNLGVARNRLKFYEENRSSRKLGELLRKNYA